MRYLIITSLSASIFTAITTQNELFSILFSVAGVFLLYWFVFHTSTMKKEIAFLKEENQYFIDSFQNIRTPVTSLHTPLKSACNNDCPDSIKRICHWPSAT